MIDVTREKLLDVEQVMELTGKCRKTIYDWFRPHDHKRRPKQRVLESVLIGGTRKTSEEALQRFVVQGARERPIVSPVSIEQQLAMAKQIFAGLGLKV